MLTPFHCEYPACSGVLP